MAARCQPVPVVVLNYQGEKLLGRCLDSLRGQAYPETEVWVADNGSTDGSLSLLTQEYPWVRVVRFSRNFGFAAGYNMALREVFSKSSSPYFATLNNDTRVDPAWLGSLVDVMTRRPEAATVTSKTKFYYEQQRIDTTGILIYADGSAQSRGHLDIDHGQYETEEEVFAASMVAALVRRAAWQEAGGFEDRFFAYHEEVDLGWRMRVLGWKAYYCPRAVAYHVHSANFVPYSTTKIYLTERNRIWHAVRNLPVGMLLRSPYYTGLRYWYLVKGLLRGRGAAARAVERASFLTVAATVLRAWIVGLALAPPFLLKRLSNHGRRRVSIREIHEWHQRFGVDVETLAQVNREP